MTTTKEEPKAAHSDEKQKAPEYTSDHPEFPKLLYNAKLRTTAVAKDKEDEGKLQGKGFSEDPYPPLPPDVMTDQDYQQLGALLKKMLNEVEKYGKLHAAEGNGKEGKTDAGGEGKKPPAR